ncbi:PadR family transcriptional regulator [Candidatus Zixiibacteriota bacterium]
MMTKRKADLLRGTLDLLILKTLTGQSLHGLGISNRIEQITEGIFQIKPGSLFPALHRLEQLGYIEGEWGESENNRRAKYYHLTTAGQRQLGQEKENWSTVVGAITRVLETS